MSRAKGEEREPHIKELFNDKKKFCPICNKEFYVLRPTLWTYKIGNRYYCGWNHYQEAKKKSNKKEYNRGA